MKSDQIARDIVRAQLGSVRRPLELESGSPAAQWEPRAAADMARSDRIEHFVNWCAAGLFCGLGFGLALLIVGGCP